MLLQEGGDASQQGIAGLGEVCADRPRRRHLIGEPHTPIEIDQTEPRGFGRPELDEKLSQFGEWNRHFHHIAGGRLLPQRDQRPEHRVTVIVGKHGLHPGLTGSAQRSALAGVLLRVPSILGRRPALNRIERLIEEMKGRCALTGLKTFHQQRGTLRKGEIGQKPGVVETEPMAIGLEHVHRGQVGRVLKQQ